MATESLRPLTRDTVEQRLSFAERRMRDLVALNAGDLAGAGADLRQQLVQEFLLPLDRRR